MTWSAASAALLLSTAACGSTGTHPAANAPRPSGTTAPATASSPHIGGGWKLTSPATLPGGYTLNPATPPGTGPAHLPAQTQPDRFDGILRAYYQEQDGNGNYLSVIGFWGDFADPNAPMSQVAANQIDHGKPLTWEKPFTLKDAKDPHDPDGKLGCGLSRLADTFGMMCAWSDHATRGTVSFTLTFDATSYPLTEDQAAALTRSTRDAMTVPR